MNERMNESMSERVLPLVLPFGEKSFGFRDLNICVIDRSTNRPTDRTSYSDARTHVKKRDRNLRMKHLFLNHIADARKFDSG